MRPCLCLTPSEAKPRPGMRRRSVRRSAPKGRCGTRSRGPSRNSLPSCANNRDESDERSARCARAATSPAFLGAAQCRCRRTPDPRLCRSTEVFVYKHLGRAARLGRYPGGATLGRREAQRRKGESGAAGGGPARSHEAAARSAPLRAASQPPLWREHRSELGAQCRPTQSEPPSGTARRAAPRWRRASSSVNANQHFRRPSTHAEST